MQRDEQVKPARGRRFWVHVAWLAVFLLLAIARVADLLYDHDSWGDYLVNAAFLIMCAFFIWKSGRIIRTHLKTQA
jgi:hypothetical protein